MSRLTTRHVEEPVIRTRSARPRCRCLTCVRSLIRCCAAGGGVRGRRRSGHWTLSPTAVHPSRSSSPPLAVGRLQHAAEHGDPEGAAEFAGEIGFRCDPANTASPANTSSTTPDKPWRSSRIVNTRGITTPLLYRKCVHIRPGVMSVPDRSPRVCQGDKAVAAPLCATAHRS